MTTKETGTIVPTKTSDTGRYYTVDEGVNPHRLWSVTTILNTYPKQLGLTGWAAGMAADKAISTWEPLLYQQRGIMANLALKMNTMVGVETLTEEHTDVLESTLNQLEFVLDAFYNFDLNKMVQKRGLPDHMVALLTRGNKTSRDKVRRRLSGAHNEHRDERADIGTEVHTAINAYVINEDRPKVSDMAEPYLEGFWKFLREQKPKILASEMVVYNESHQWAGTLDAVMEFGDGKTYVVDHKTGKSIWPDAALQLAAYNNAEYFELPKQPRDKDGDLWDFDFRFPGRQREEALILHLKEGDYSVQPMRTTETEYQTFRHLMETYRWIETNSDDVKMEAWDGLHE